MAVYGKLILNEQSLDNFVDVTICDGDKEKIELCHKYIADKLKPLQETVRKAITKLKMSKFCKPVTSYNDISDIFIIGLEIAWFDHDNIVDEHGNKIDDNSNEGYNKLLSTLRKYSNQIIDEVRKTNKIEGIHFNYYQEERDDTAYNPAVFINVEKKFFEDFLKEHPITKPQERTPDEIKKISAIITKRLKSILNTVNSNKSLIMTDEIKEMLKKEIETMETQVKFYKDKVSSVDINDIDTIRKVYYGSVTPEEYPDSTIKRWFKDKLSVWENNIKRNEKEIKELNGFLKLSGIPNITIG